jgi:hypothetical protein
MLDRQNHAAGGANGSIMVGMFVCLCLASKKPSQQEFFVPAGTDLGAKLLRNKKTLAKLNNGNEDSIYRTFWRNLNRPIAKVAAARLNLAIFWIKHQDWTSCEIGVIAKPLV